MEWQLFNHTVIFPSRAIFVIPRNIFVVIKNVTIVTTLGTVIYHITVTTHDVILEISGG